MTKLGGLGTVTDWRRRPRVARQMPSPQGAIPAHFRQTLDGATSQSCLKGHRVVPAALSSGRLWMEDADTREEEDR